MKNKYSKALVLIVAFLILTLTTIASYAYFTASVAGNTTASNTVIQTGTMQLLLTDGEQVSLENAIPGTSVTKSFKVKNTGTVQTNYDVYLSEIINTFVDKNDLVYTLTSADGCPNSTETIVPSTTGEQSKIVSSCLINPNIEHEYVLTIKFNEDNTNQDDNKGKKFSAKISVNEYQAYQSTEPYEDGVIASAPKIFDGLIPVTIDETGETKGTVRVADISSEWYNYGSSKHQWANAVIVSNPESYKTAGTEISMNDILQMYVWIPRYKYKLWNAENGSSDEQMIEIEFEDATTTKSTGSKNGKWLTHPAFTFGSTELSGFWVGKFETGYAGAADKASAQVDSVDAAKVIIKPSVHSWRSITLGNIFNTTRGIESELMYGLTSNQVDTHMMKNMEWGAVAYLSHSLYGRYTSSSTCISSGCEIWTNPNKLYLTGYSGTSSKDDASTTGAPWNDSTSGGNSSTTGNLTGVYDMSGGAWEYVMGNVATGASTYTWTVGSSGLSTAPEAKYYDAYTNSEDAYDAHQNGKLGDATKETLKTFASTTGGWYSDLASFPLQTLVWFVRGGIFSAGDTAGVFHFANSYGNTYGGSSWRVVLSAQDGND